MLPIRIGNHSGLFDLNVWLSVGDEEKEHSQNGILRLAIYSYIARDIACSTGFDRSIGIKKFEG